MFSQRLAREIVIMSCTKFSDHQAILNRYCRPVSHVCVFMLWIGRHVMVSLPFLSTISHPLSDTHTHTHTHTNPVLWHTCRPPTFMYIHAYIGILRCLSIISHPLSHTHTHTHDHHPHGHTTWLPRACDPTLGIPLHFISLVHDQTTNSLNIVIRIHSVSTTCCQRISDSSPKSQMPHTGIRDVRFPDLRASRPCVRKTVLSHILGTFDGQRQALGTLTPL
jgi:hypothetical protein